MAGDTTIERILNRLSDSDEGVSVKTASATEPSAEAKMLATIRRVSDSVVKTASETSAPATELGRIAKEAADAEQQSLLKQATFLGAALADGFMERYAQYDAALTSSGVKTASADPELVKKAAEEGYARAVADMEKRAEEEFNRGYEDQLKAIHKTAAEIHLGGQNMAHAVVERLTAQTK
jgi:hypothetical protein